MYHRFVFLLFVGLSSLFPVPYHAQAFVRGTGKRDCVHGHLVMCQRDELDARAKAWPGPPHRGLRSCYCHVYLDNISSVLK
jgi:hypothetical protein